MSDRSNTIKILYSLLGDVDIYFKCAAEGPIRDLDLSAFVEACLNLSTSSHNLLLRHDLLSQVLLVIVHVVRVWLTENLHRTKGLLESEINVPRSRLLSTSNQCLPNTKGEIKMKRQKYCGADVQVNRQSPVGMPRKAVPWWGVAPSPKLRPRPMTRLSVRVFQLHPFLIFDKESLFAHMGVSEFPICHLKNCPHVLVQS